MLSNLEEKYFKEITQLVGPSGCENNVAFYLKNEYEKLGFETIVDNLGSIFALKKSKNPDAKRVMVAGHLDEVGFYVVRILENGLIQTSPIGIHNLVALQGQRVVALNNKNQQIHGVIDANYELGSYEKTALNAKSNLFDFGFTSKEEVLKAGINIGTPITFEGKFEYSFNKEAIMSKALDSRFGLILGLELLNEVKDLDLPFDLYVGGTVQSEVAHRGANTASYMIKPDLSIVLETAPAKDYDSLNNHGKLGSGVLVRILDRTMIGFKSLLDFQTNALNTLNIPYQNYETTLTSDTGNIHRSLDGIVTLSHGVCVRNMHTPSALISVKDYEGCRDSLTFMIKELTNETIEGFKRRGL